MRSDPLDGWRPLPFHEFIFKVHSRCNLACDYCYVYTMGDQGWRQQPRVMATGVIRTAAERIADHAADHRLREIRLVLHGGEALLAGAETLAMIRATVQAALPARTRIDTTVQTNGVLLDDHSLSILQSAGIRVGVSLDGGTMAHNQRRRYLSGRPSFDDVRRALSLLCAPPYRAIFGGILCTVDLTNDPVAVYESLLEFSPPMMDFLLPHANWSAPPPRPGVPNDPHPYGDWLVKLFDRWHGATRAETRIRLFEGIIAGLLGGISRSEQVGLAPARTIVIETNGDIEQVDALKSTFPGAAATGLNVMIDPLDAALTHPGVVMRQLGRAALSSECLDCDLHQVCGGGHYVHRYRRGAGFRNPSVYCADLYHLIDHVSRTMRAGLAAARRAVP